MADTSLYPSILPSRDEPYVDNCYSKAELERKERPELQRIAAEHPAEAVNGKDKSEAIIEVLTGEERVE